MDKLILEGKTFISARRAARDFDYTPDYIGQLCRAKKVEAQLVGRSWYVSLDSIKQHQEGLKAESAVVAPPVVSIKAAQAERSRSAEIPLQHTVVYATDDRPLLPGLQKRHLIAVPNPSVPAVAATSLDFLAQEKSPVSEVLLQANARGNLYAHSLLRTLRMLPVPIAAFLIAIVVVSAGIGLPSEFVVQNLVAPSSNLAALSGSATQTAEATPLIVASAQGISPQVVVPTSQIAEAHRGVAPIHPKNSSLVATVSAATEPLPHILSTQQKGVAPLQSSVASVSSTREPLPLIVSKQMKGILATLITAPTLAVVPTTASAPSSSPSQSLVAGNATTQQIIERATASGLTASYIDEKLQELNNKLSSQIYALSAQTGSNTTRIIDHTTVIAQTNRIDKLSGVDISASNFDSGTITNSSFSGTTGTFTGGVSVGGDSSVAGGFSVGTSGLVYDSSTGYVGIGTATPNYALTVVGAGQFSSYVDAPYFVATSTTATSTFAGGALFTRAPTLPHTFSPWTPGATGSNLFDASLVVNPSSAVADGNLIAAAVNGSIKFLVDGEGDVFVNNLTSVGDVTLSNTSASTFSVEGDTTLGDAITDTTTINGTLVVTGTTTASTVAGNFGVGTTTPWARLSVAGAAGGTLPLFTISSSTSGYATSTVLLIDSSGRIGIGTETPSSIFEINGTDALRIPVGTTAQRPGTALTGQIRYNTTTAQFEGYGGSAWQGLGGVIDANQDTKITADTNNLNEDYLRFFTEGAERVTITDTGLFGIGTTSPASLFSVQGDGLFSGNLSVAAITATSTITSASTITAASTVTGSNLVASSGTATSTLAGGLAIETNGFVYDYSTNRVGIGTALPSAQLQLNTTAGSNAFLIGSSTAQFIVDSLGNVGVGTSSAESLLGWSATSKVLTVSNQAAGAARVSVVGTSANLDLIDTNGTAGTRWFNLNQNSGIVSFRSFDDSASTISDLLTLDLSTGNFGIGTTSPSKRLSIKNTASDSQLSLAYDDTRYAQFQVDSSGDLIIHPSGNDVRLNDDNLYVCSGGACPAGTTVSGNGNVIVENNLGLGTSSPSQQLGVLNNIFVAGGGSPALGTATSTFSGDIRILGKLDVGTIDPVYTIDGTKYATYGISSVGVKEETSMNIEVADRNPQTGEYEYAINFSDLPKGSDTWLFYQVTDFGDKWKNLVVTLTAGFDGTVHYVKDVTNGKLIISSTAAGEVAVHMIANRFDSTSWPNVRPDQGGWPGFILSAKKALFGN